MKKITLALLLGCSFLGAANLAHASITDPVTVLKKRPATFATANDDCSNAIAITTFPYSFFQADGTDAAQDGMSYTCMGPMNDGLWFKVEGNGNSLFIKVTPEGEYNPELGIYSGNCEALECVGNSDNGYEGEPEIYVIGASEIGKTYYINVGSYHGAIDQPEGNFTIEVESLPTPSNDNCIGAIDVVSFPYTGEQTDGAGASMDGFVVACEDWETNDGLWYAFTGDGGDVEITVTTGEDYDAAVSVFTGSCAELECIGAVDDEVSGDEIFQITGSEAGKVYYVNVGHYDSFNDFQEGNFTIHITSTGDLGNGHQKLQGFNVYPNPTNDLLHPSHTADISSVEVFNIMGQKMLDKTMDAAEGQLDLSTLSSGSYLVKVVSGNETKTIRVIKQ